MNNKFGTAFSFFVAVALCVMAAGQAEVVSADNGTLLKAQDSAGDLTQAFRANNAKRTEKEIDQRLLALIGQRRLIREKLLAHGIRLLTENTGTMSGSISGGMSGLFARGGFSGSMQGESHQRVTPGEIFVIWRLNDKIAAKFDAFKAVSPDDTAYECAQFLLANFKPAIDSTLEVQEVKTMVGDFGKAMAALEPLVRLRGTQPQREAYMDLVYWGKTSQVHVDELRPDNLYNLGLDGNAPNREIRHTAWNWQCKAGTFRSDTGSNLNNLRVKDIQNNGQSYYQFSLDWIDKERRDVERGDVYMKNNTYWIY